MPGEQSNSSPQAPFADVVAPGSHVVLCHTMTVLHDSFAWTARLLTIVLLEPPLFV